MSSLELAFVNIVTTSLGQALFVLCIEQDSLIHTDEVIFPLSGATCTSCASFDTLSFFLNKIFETMPSSADLITY